MTKGFKSLFKKSFKDLWVNLFGFLVLTLIVLVIVFLIQFLSGDIIISSISALVLSPLYYFLLAKSSIDVVNGDKLKIKNVFKSLNTEIYKKFFTIGLLIFIYTTFLGFAVGFASSFFDVLISNIVFLTLLFFSIYLFSGIVMFSHYLVLEKSNKSVIELFGILYKKSSTMRWYLFKNILMIILLNILGALLLGVGVIITIPLSSIYIANIYKSLEFKN